jgi:hypothetical protein
MGEERKVYKVLVGKPEGKRPLERPRHRWEDGIIRLTGMRINRGSSPPPPLTTMCYKEFTHACELTLVCHYL